MRNEILEIGQEIVLYVHSNWKGEISGSGVLLRKLRTSDIDSELWKISTHDNPYVVDDKWWFGKVKE